MVVVGRGVEQFGVLRQTHVAAAELLTGPPQDVTESVDQRHLALTSARL